MKRLTAFCALLACSSLLTLSAMPAWRGAVKRTQPDGQSITTYLLGDEHGSLLVTSDGYTIAQAPDGYYHYQVLGSDNKLTISGTPIVRDPSMRLSSDKEFLQNVPKMAELQRKIEHLQKASYKASEVAESSKKTDFTDMRMRQFPAKGKFKGIVILAQFQDAQFKYSRDYFDRMLNEVGFSDNGSHGSAHDYWLKQSNGQFDATFDVVGPITLSHDYAYYGADAKDVFGKNTGDADGAKAIDEAVRLADADVDFSQYDLDNDGKVDMVYVIYAGYGENFGADANTIWPHQYELISAGYRDTCDAKIVDTYACSAELYGASGDTPCGIGPLCHEFGHVYGFADHYDTKATEYDLGTYDLMDYGAYNDSTRMPPSYTAFERLSLGWMQPRELTDPDEELNLPCIAESNVAYVVPTAYPDEYYLLENRQQEGWDASLPGSGLMITHLDFNASDWTKNTVNATSSHRRYYLVCADNDPNYDAQTKTKTEMYDLYPAKGNNAFTDSTTPAATTFGGGSLDRWITNIKNSDGVVTFSYMADYQHTPSGLAASAITDNSFTANWKADDNVSAYNLRWHRLIHSSELPVAYESGASKLNGDSFTTPALDLHANNGQFAVVVRAHSDAGQTPVFTVSANGKSGKTRLSAATRNYMFKFDNGLTATPVALSVNTGSAYIDSIVVVRGDGSAFTGESRNVAVTGTAASTDNPVVEDILVATDTTTVSGITANSYTLSGLEKDCWYSFEVQAVANGDHKESLWSKSYTVYTDAATGIGKIEIGDEMGEKVEYFTISGQKISRAPKTGFYLEKRGSKVRKIYAQM